MGTLDFASFTIKKENYGTTIRTVNNIKIRHFGKTTHISFTGEGFMRFQVRNLAGALLAHNRGNLTDIELKELISLPEKGKCH
ncbi:MAG: hypothetical protein DRP42_03415 [Tenericutes bacterium]|nr:MAG: hypothetical protein DRP42_03415 [Mycoplasmatota bacterium]